VTKLVECYIWSTASYDAETWTLWKVDEKYLGPVILEMKEYYIEPRRTGVLNVQ
jgi:hypothetical protein